MYTLIPKTVLKNHDIRAKTIRSESILLNDLNSLALVPLDSEVLVFFDHSLSITYLMDLRSALNLKVTVVVNNEKDYSLCCCIFDTKLVDYNFIDGSLIRAIVLNDDGQVKSLTQVKRTKHSETELSHLLDEAKRLMTSQSSTEAVKMLAAAFTNMVDVDSYLASEYQKKERTIFELSSKNTALQTTLTQMSKDVEDFIKAYSQMQTQMLARNVLDVIRDNSSLIIPPTVTSLVIKNYGIPNLMRFVAAVKDSLTTSYDKYTKVLYLCEPDPVSLNEVRRSGYFLLQDTVQASDVLKNDLFICVGNVKAPVEFLLSASTADVLIIIDSRRSLTQLISGQTMTLYTAMDIDMANNLGLDPNYTITSSEKSVYTLRETDFIGKKMYALRSNDLVTRVVNSLLDGGF